MPTPPDLSPFTFDVENATAGALLCHGFTGSPASMRPWGEHLRNAGISAHCPLLPGHGTSWQEMNTTTWHDWFDGLHAAFDTMRRAMPGRPIIAMGLSMGGTLVTRLAQLRQPELAGLVLVNPSYMTLRRAAILAPALSRMVSSLPGLANDIKKPGILEGAYPRTPLRAFNSLRALWRLTTPALSKLTLPILVFHSTIDHIVEPANTELLLRSVSSTDVTDIELTNSYHVATLDNDAEAIFTGSVEFIRRLLRQETTHD